MSREDYDAYDAIKLQRQQEGAEYRAASTKVWRDAQALAHQHGLIMRRHTEHHYGLSERGELWLINLYPGNQRVYSAPNQRFQYVQLPAPWNVLDVVNAVIAKRAGLEVIR